MYILVCNPWMWLTVLQYIFRCVMRLLVGWLKRVSRKYTKLHLLESLDYRIKLENINIFIYYRTGNSSTIVNKFLFYTITFLESWSIQDENMSTWQSELPAALGPEVKKPEIYYVIYMFVQLPFLSSPFVACSSTLL